MIGTDTDKIRITTFTDPMMGLSYECEPIFRKLETHLGDNIEFKYCMSLLVEDVSNFMNQSEVALPPKEGIALYNKRLATIYKSEEYITGMPIIMDDFRLFDEKHRSTLPFNLAFKTVEIVAPEKSNEFLYRLRYATIVDTLPTTHYDEILKVIDSLVIDKPMFEEVYTNGQASHALDKDLEITKELGIHSLPAYLIEYKNKSLLINQLIGYDDFVRLIGELSEGSIKPQVPNFSMEYLETLIKRRGLISDVEIKYVFSSVNEQLIDNMITALRAKAEYVVYPVAESYFIRLNH